MDRPRDLRALGQHMGDVAAPAGGVVASAQPLRGCLIERQLDAASRSACDLEEPRPNWLEDEHDVGGPYR